MSRALRVRSVGAGLAGLACALRLADAGVPVTVIAAGAGSLQLGGATIDVLGYAPERVERPLEALAGLAAGHPYALLGAARVEAAAVWLSERLPAAWGCADRRPRTCCSRPRSAPPAHRHRARGDRGRRPAPRRRGVRSRRCAR